MENILLVIVTSLISGLLATLITIIWQKVTEEKHSKRKIFETLMSYRYDICDEKNVAALNKINVIFQKNKNVLEAYKEFKSEADNAALNLDKPNHIFDKHLKILEEMAKCLGYKSINWEVIKSYYLPQGLSNKLQEETMLRKVQLQQAAQINNSNANIQVNTSEQFGMQMAMKILESPNGVQDLIKLAEKFQKNDSNKKQNKNQ